ncbi:hypothetical protein FFJ24_002660 [Pedobacter sp. KBS0701]|uniref:hypothetical protein n=1 Tax=Pedobacter sp. KBS0701 TaxID=2578106 RepID=UPI00110DF50A|nr:hypothetical protein [Pedobacter sp. KBS0701]QDW23783.1 hypothetical protein FFJ24_002660 [Pedobacter sp. KBS0701]
MKRLLILLIAVICSSHNTFAVDKNPVNDDIDSMAIIKKIKSDFASINKKLKFYKKKKRDAFGMSAEGGEVTGYYSKGALKKIHCVFYGETGKAESDYYFNNSGLFFLYKKEVFYNKPISLKGFKIKSSIETRYYLFGDKVIKTIVKPNTLVLSYVEIKAGLEQIMDILNEK